MHFFPLIKYFLIKVSLPPKHSLSLCESRPGFLGNIFVDVLHAQTRKDNF
jgi:hypothetical protein